MQIEQIVVDDPNYPLKLKELTKKPNPLYYMGDISLLSQKTIAMIGTRRCSEQSRRYAYQLGEIAAKQELVVVNGLAIGCDSEAIKGVMKQRGKAIAVLPCGLDEVYPKANKELAEKILENGGCLMSEYPDGMKPQKFSFVERDRLQAAVADGVFVVECDSKSGTMHTVNAARRLEKYYSCLRAALVDNAKGNEEIEKYNFGNAVATQSDFVDFCIKIKAEKAYEQLELKFDT